MTEAERECLERAIARMGWPEINAFRAELHKGQSIYEDAGGYMMRAIRRLFGLPQDDEEVLTYRRAALRLTRTPPSEQVRNLKAAFAEHNISWPVKSAADDE